MIIDEIEINGAPSVKGAEYVDVGKSFYGFTCLQVRRIGSSRVTNIEVGRVRQIEVGDPCFSPPSPDYSDVRAAEI